MKFYSTYFPSHARSILLLRIGYYYMQILRYPRPVFLYLNKNGIVSYFCCCLPKLAYLENNLSYNTNYKSRVTKVAWYYILRLFVSKVAKTYP